jgi:hypothetical protein
LESSSSLPPTSKEAESAFVLGDDDDDDLPPPIEEDNLPPAYDSSDIPTRPIDEKPTLGSEKDPKLPKDSSSSNLHYIRETDTLLGIAFEYGVEVCFLFCHPDIFFVDS